MLKGAVKLMGSIVKASKSKAVPDVIKAGTQAIGLAEKVTKKKKRDEPKKKQKVRG